MAALLSFVVYVLHLICHRELLGQPISREQYLLIDFMILESKLLQIAICHQWPNCYHFDISSIILSSLKDALSSSISILLTLWLYWFEEFECITKVNINFYITPYWYSRWSFAHTLAVFQVYNFFYF